MARTLLLSQGMANTRKFWVKVCQSGVVILTGLSWLSGCEKSGDPGAMLGDACEGTHGDPGVIVEDRSECAEGLVFCDQRPDDTYCTGPIRSKCPPPGEQSDEQRSCRPPEGTGGQGAGGSGGDGAGGSLGGATNDPIGSGCTSLNGLNGKVVGSRGECWKDDAFCSALADGTFCTGYMPFVCPEGQVRISWIQCGPDPNGLGGAGAGGEGGAG